MRGPCGGKVPCTWSGKQPSSFPAGVFVFLHLGEESLDFSCLHWEICQREKNRVGKARNISCIPPGIFEQSLAFTMSQRDWTWMRSEKKGEQE